MKFLKVLGVIFSSFVTLSWQCDIHSLKHHHSQVESLNLVCTLKKSVFLLVCVFAGMNINYDLPPEASLLDVSRWPSPDPRSSQAA